MGDTWKRFRRDRLALAGLAIIVIFAVAAAAAPLLAPFDPSEQFFDGLTLEGSPLPPNARFWLGTDTNGRDQFSRLLYGAQTSLLIGIVANGIAVDTADPVVLMLFPEMDATADVPEITTACWGILGKSPDSLMCASARMVVKRKGAARPAVLACTLLAYDPQFELGATLAEASRPVALNHPHCAKFCVLGGAACSR